MTIHLQIGARPWLGTRKGEIVEELSFHDIPLVTLVEIDGGIVLAQCIIGEIEVVNVWLYTPVTAADIAAIEASTPTTFREVIERISTRSTHVAVAVDGDGIVAWVEWADWPSREAAMERLAEIVARHIIALEAREDRRAEVPQIQGDAMAARTQAERMLAPA
jgi:sulfur carrier protein ThiS